MTLDSKGIALITGASSGIGAVYADRLARRGHDLILVARNRERLGGLSARLTDETGHSVEMIVADLNNQANLAQVEQRLRDDDRITVLVNNAGITASGGLVDANLDLLEKIIRVNAVAVMRLAGAVVPGFVARGRGTVINIGSVTALMPETFNGTYSGTKAFVLNFSQALQAEVGKRGIRVQVVLPGRTRTEIWERAGIDFRQLPPETIMEVHELVDAALAGLDRGELVTVPSLPEPGEWEAFTAARLALGPNLSRNYPAERYRTVDGDGLRTSCD